MGRTGRRTRWTPLVVSLTLLLGLGAFGLTLVRSSNAAAEEALGDGAVDKQRTVAALTDQYLQLAAKEAFDLDAGQALDLVPGSAADREALAQLLAKRGGFFDQGAVLTDLRGEALSGTGEVPPITDPGYAPLEAALLRGEPGVSSLMWLDDVPVVAVGVPVLRDDTPAALLIAAFRADTSMLQRYSEKLGTGSDGIGMVVDGEGTIVAARHADLVGTPLPESPAGASRAAGTSGHEVFERDGTEMVATWAPIETGGWTLVEEAPAATFYASVRSQSNTAQLALLGLLVGAALSAALLNHRTNRARRRGEQRAEALVRDAHDVITIVSDGTVTFASPATSRVLGYDPEDFVGRPALALVHPDDLDRVNEAVSEAAGSPGARQRIQARVRRADGQYCSCELVISNQRDDRSIAGTIVSMRDISELVALHDRLSHQALHDPLTELPNRTQLERRMNEALASCGEGTRRIGVLFLDLDGFKAVNDELGHDRGDELLVQVAGRLQTCVREGDTVARLGGDEFVIVLNSDEAELDAARVASRVLDVLASTFQVGGHSVRVGASIGISIGGAGREPDTLLREADAAMYLAKDRGRFRYEFPSAGLAGTGVTVSDRGELTATTEA